MPVFVLLLPAPHPANNAVILLDCYTDYKEGYSIANLSVQCLFSIDKG